MTGPFPYITAQDVTFIEGAVRKEHEDVKRLVYAGHVFTRAEVVQRCITELESGISYVSDDFAAMEIPMEMPDVLQATLVAQCAVYAEQMADATMAYIRVLEADVARERGN